MGWKSTIDINRSDAQRLILMRTIALSHYTNEELSQMLESLGYGDETDLAYYGYNFNVIND